MEEKLSTKYNDAVQQIKAAILNSEAQYFQNQVHY